MNIRRQRIYDAAANLSLAPAQMVLFVSNKNDSSLDFLLKKSEQIKRTHGYKLPLHIQAVATDDTDLLDTIVARRVNIGSIESNCFISSSINEVKPLLSKLNDVSSLDSTPLIEISEPKFDQTCLDECKNIALQSKEIEHNIEFHLPLFDAFREKFKSLSARQKSVPEECKAQPEAIPVDNEADIAESERQKFVDQLSALILDYVTRMGEMPPLQEINELIQGKITLAQKGLSRIIINKRREIVFADYNEIQLPLSPIQKTIYILFLRHPNGIAMRDFPGFKEELRKIYLHEVMPSRDDEVIDRTLSRLCDIEDNSSLREKISCINRVVKAKILNENLNSEYCILGKRGENYGIKLSRDLVMWC